MNSLFKIGLFSWLLLLGSFDRAQAGSPERTNSGFAQAGDARPSRPPPVWWPDAYSRRGYKLGMTLAQFKQTQYPDQKEWPNAFPICSDEIPEKLKNEIALIDLQHGKWSELGVVLCQFFYQFSKDQISTAGLMLGEVSPSVNNFYFLATDPGEQPVLFFIETNGPKLVMGASSKRFDNGSERRPP